MIQISNDCFAALMRAMLIYDGTDNIRNDYPALCAELDTVKRHIEDKAHRIQKQHLYTAYKSETDPVTREIKRHAYLQCAGIAPDYITDTELRNDNL